MAGLPAELVSAINTASKTFGVPADVLTGIWRIESGSTYPNPAVNSSGYGGLFGTHLWNGSTAAQANYAASILANLLQKSGGNMAAALHAYSGGGYTSVPGAAGGYNQGSSSPLIADATVPQAATQDFTSAAQLMALLNQLPAGGKGTIKNPKVVFDARPPKHPAEALTLAHQYIHSIKGAFTNPGFARYLHGLNGSRLPRSTVGQSRAGRLTAPGEGNLAFFGNPPVHQGVLVDSSHVLHATNGGTVLHVGSIAASPLAGSLSAIRGGF